jgi:hypothetical protein
VEAEYGISSWDETMAAMKSKGKTIVGVLYRRQ